MSRLSIIIPCYFNEENIPLLTKRLIENEKLFDKDVNFEYIMIDDGFKDLTLNKLIEFKNKYNNKVKVIKFSGNFGSYNAILAGLNFATGDCCSILTADLQDPPELLPKMYEYWKKGIKLVVANRENREDPLFNKLFSSLYHFLMKKFALPNIPSGGFDLVLFDKQLRDEIIRIDEKNTNQIYLLSWLRYDYVNIPYTRKKREVGKSRWTFSKKIKLFIDSFVAFSFFPIRVISITGLLLGFVAFLYGVFIIIARLSGLIVLPGYAAIMAVLLFVSSFQMISIGIIGEYLWRTLDATRKRPNYVIEKIY